MGNKYTFSRKGLFFIVRNGTRIIYKSKNKDKARMIYDRASYFGC